jgi:hypothetical protein
MSGFSELSRCLTASLTKDEKKNCGIFFTPPVCIALLRKLPEEYRDAIKTILETSCGSGEFISALLPELWLRGDLVVVRGVPNRESPHLYYICELGQGLGDDGDDDSRI